MNFWRIYIDSMFVLISWRQKRISDAIISIIIAKPHTQILNAHFDKKSQKKFGTFQIYANVFSEQKIGLFRLQNTHTPNSVENKRHFHSWFYYLLENSTILWTSLFSVNLTFSGKRAAFWCRWLHCLAQKQREYRVIFLLDSTYILHSIASEW